MAFEYNNTVLINGSTYTTKDLPQVCTQLLATAQDVQLKYLLIVGVGFLNIIVIALLIIYMRRFIEAKRKEHV